MNPPTTSDTPRTEAECIQIYQEDVTGCSSAIDYVPASVARTLERELADAKEEFARFKESTWEHFEYNRKQAVARSIERDNDKDEIARLRADLERFTGHGLLDCHAICDQRDAAVAERDRLRAEVERLKGALALGQQNCDDAYDDLREERDEAIARAEKAEAERDALAKDKVRLDWLEKNWIHWPITQNEETIREAIDAAMKGTK